MRNRGEKTKEMMIVEQRFGEDIETLIRREYLERNRTQAEVAKMLGVKEATVSVWRLRLGIPGKVLVSREAVREAIAQ